MHKDLPYKLSEVFVSHYWCTWLGVVLMEDNSLLLPKVSRFLVNCCFQTVQLLKVQDCIKSLAVWKQLTVDDSLLIPPNIQQNFLDHKFWLSHCLHRITSLVPRLYCKWSTFHHQLPSASTEGQRVAIQQRFADEYWF